MALELSFQRLIAAEIGCRVEQVAAVDALFADGATVPFVARYRKEASGGLDDAQLEILAKRRDYFATLAARRESILASLEEQRQLTPALAAAIRAATGKQELEDLYLPFRPKRRTRAQIAHQRGLLPLADALVAGARSAAAAESLAAPFVDPQRGVESAEQALAGARDLLAERLAEEATHRARLRRVLAGQGIFHTRVRRGQERAGAVYRDYFDFAEPVSRIPSHRLLAALRGERDGYLATSVEIDDEAEIARLAASFGAPLETPCGRQLAAAAADGYKRLLRPSITHEVAGRLRERAEIEAIGVFRANLEALLMQAPLGPRSVMGVDPGLRTGCKVAVVDPTGRVLATTTLFPQVDAEKAAARALGLVRSHGVRAIAVGNGTASRETERFLRRALQGSVEGEIVVAIVPETGASVYSASEVARQELPDLDVSLRGAVSIARRLQDPLAELVKIEPRALGVGQYQHDVDQKALAEELARAVEGVVNRVGVELGTASPRLLRHVSGLSDRLAAAIVRHRDEGGLFRSRRALLAVPGLGPKTFEQAAGFLRVRGGDEPLDATAVHPERYRLVRRMAKRLGVAVGELVGNPALADRLELAAFEDPAAGIGRFTLEDIRAELRRPGRDPRPEFVTPSFREDVACLDDLRPGMVLEGRVSNVTNFGAFVDLGVKRDGLIHISELAAGWVADPREVIRVGEVVQVRVLEVDRERGRIGLSRKALLATPPRG